MRVFTLSHNTVLFFCRYLGGCLLKKTVRKHLESLGSFVSQGGRPDSSRGRRIGTHPNRSVTTNPQVPLKHWQGLVNQPWPKLVRFRSGNYHGRLACNP